MSVADGALRRALSGLAEGGGTVWRPDLTTSQLAKASIMDAIMATRSSSRVFNADAYSLWYRATSGEPTDWEMHLDGGPSFSAANGVLEVNADAEGEYVLWSHDLPELSSGLGTTLEFDVKIVSGDSGADRGAAVSVSDGDHRYAVWLRPDGFNIHGEPHMPATLGDRRHRIRLFCIAGGCEVSVDGVLRQRGPAAGATSDRLVEFGSWVRILAA